jgi:hypothetical protein
MTNTIFSLCTTALLLGCSLRAQELDLSFLKDLEAKAVESTNITMGKEQLDLIKSFTGGLDKDLMSLAAGLELVQVKVMEFDKPGMFQMADMENLKNKVKSSGVVPMVSVKEKNGFTEIFLRKGEKGMRGFVILAAEDTELTIVNIVGDLDANSLAKLSGKFGIPNISMENRSSGSGSGKSKATSGGSGKKDDDEEQ